MWGAVGWWCGRDLDCPEAIAAAKELLPHTGLIHGRPSKVSSHMWFICEGVKTEQFKDASGKSSIIVEIRSTGGYTCAPPSLHTSGEQLAWERQGNPLPSSPPRCASPSAMSPSWPCSTPLVWSRSHAYRHRPARGVLCHAGLESGRGGAHHHDRVQYCRRRRARREELMRHPPSRSLRRATRYGSSDTQRTPR